MRNATVKLQEYKRAISTLAALESSDAGINVEACLVSIDESIHPLIEEIAAIKRNPNIPENIKDHLCKYIELSMDRVKMHVRPIMRGLTPGLVEIFECEDERLSMEKTFCDLLGNQKYSPHPLNSDASGVRDDVSAIASVAESSSDAIDEQLVISYRNVVRKAAASAMQVLVAVGVPGQ
ncbi:hypothetical protein GCM10023116_19880 [Kistimonas scapharcae]|uniref:Uncharacterized protein n=2 Tax=Kistimonas scapharcae TaxID=1036133 RepID=A0ABP8V2S2_9GAMM